MAKWSFLDLLRELRDMIYDYRLSVSYYMIMRGDRSHDLNILIACRQMSEEVLDTL